MELNNIQNLAVSMAERNDFIFSITGSAGTGKSATIKAIVETIGKDVVVLAPTGRAAKLLESKIGQGTTIHKFWNTIPETMERHINQDLMPIINL